MQLVFCGYDWALFEPRLSRAVGVAALVSATACFVGYDSRWGEAKRAQQHAAADSKPASIIASPGDVAAPDAGRKSLSIRVRPSSSYLAQTVDVPKRVADLLDDANGVLWPSLGVRLELDRIQPWSSDVDQQLQPALDALSREDEGNDVDVVVGMIGALPRQTDSLHELGMATLLGRHVVVRAASRAGEHDAIDRSFYELSQDERSRLVRLRERHRALAVFLHEFGHTLGAVHETDPRSLMHSSYDSKMSGFSGGAVSLMRVALADSDRAAVASAQLAILRDTSGADWVAGDREQEMASLARVLTAGTEERAAATVAVAAKQEGPPELRGDDGVRFAQASEAFRHGAIGPAYDAAKPLFAAYPNVVVVQDLRCQLATVRWLDRSDLRTECAPFERLSTISDAGADATR